MSRGSVVASTLTAGVTVADAERHIMDWHTEAKTASTERERQVAGRCRDNWLDLRAELLLDEIPEQGV